MLPAEGDIAYTSGGEYYLTGRLGKGVLIDAKTFEEVQWYQLQNPMTACAFSPDDQELYIVDSARTLYIFDAHLPTRIVEWELID